MERLESTTCRPRRAGRTRAVGGTFLVLGLALLLALSSCATVPQQSIPTGSSLTALLPSDAFAYASIRVSRSRRLVADVVKESGLKSSIIASVLDKTSRLYASAQLDRAGKASFSLIGDGSYPIGLIGWNLDTNSKWKRSSAPLPWWQERSGSTQISVPARSLLMVSNGRLPTMLSRLKDGVPATLNPTVAHIFEASDLAVYFPKVGSGTPLFGKEAARFPIKSFYLSIGAGSSTAPAAGAVSASLTVQYHGYAVFKMNSERDARLFSVVFKLLIASSAGGGAIRGFPIPLAGARLSVDGDTIRLQGISVSETELAGLLSNVIGAKGAGT